MPLYADLTLRLSAALIAGALIGLERTYHSRPAGFRTYALVCLGSALLIVFAFYVWDLAPKGGRSGDALAASSRVTQGIVTGIGFLGAGVIFKDGLNIHGLTSAASIWTTAAIGILLGAGFWFPATLGVAAVLATLSVLRWAEDRMPRYVVFEHVIKFDRAGAPEVTDIYALLREFEFRTARMRQTLNDTTGQIEYTVTAYTRRPAAGDMLAARLKAMPNVVGFDVAPSDD
jgi:putative Mg2+ transporter-C (MgtC) family protein